jgi:hypothetical protein
VLIAELRGLVGELHEESQRASPPRERSQARRLKDELQGLIDEYIRESRDLGLGVCGVAFGVWSMVQDDLRTLIDGCSSSVSGSTVPVCGENWGGRVDNGLESAIRKARAVS